MTTTKNIEHVRGAVRDLFQYGVGLGQLKTWLDQDALDGGQYYIDKAEELAVHVLEMLETVSAVTGLELDTGRLLLGSLTDLENTEGADGNLSLTDLCEDAIEELYRDTNDHIGEVLL